MCLTCGCMDAHLEMGESNITYEDIKRVADENGRSVAETIDIMERTEGKTVTARQGVRASRRLTPPTRSRLNRGRGRLLSSPAPGTERPRTRLPVGSGPR